MGYFSINDKHEDNVERNRYMHNDIFIMKHAN